MKNKGHRKGTLDTDCKQGTKEDTRVEIDNHRSFRRSASNLSTSTGFFGRTPFIFFSSAGGAEASMMTKSSWSPEKGRFGQLASSGRIRRLFRHCELPPNRSSISL